MELIECILKNHGSIKYRNGNNKIGNISESDIFEIKFLF